MHPIGTYERKARREGAAAPPLTNRTRRDADRPAAMGHRPVTAADAVRGDALAALRSRPDVERAAARVVARAEGRARYLARQVALRRAGAARVFATD